VVASESYKDFVNALQRDISESLSARPRFATKEFFSGKILRTPTGDISVNPQRADQIYRYLAENDYTDESNRITRAYHEAKKTETLAALPQELAPYAEQVFQLIDSVFSDAQVVDIEDDRRLKSHSLSSNPHKKELQDIQSRIDRKPVDSAHFDTKELVEKCIRVIDRDLKVAQLHYTVYRGEQKDLASYDEIKQEDGFELRETHTAAEKRSLHSAVEYDLVGAISAGTQLTRRTIATILQGISQPVFGQFCVNPDDFISKATNLIEKQKATTLVDLRVGSSPDIFTPVLRRA
jgi:type III restriction enzyme